ncbi:phopholipase domain protein [Chlamydia pneumoniae LPCoLN]|uniref:phospholipase D-like domain-containing protein n=1 Tax=Chlamydia pneumoniae TaxID=83558 RepID=UPI0001BD9C59|nr:phospholipase D-like domain-containing protein [Chlamydia pneumoniae]ACZ33306.1 phopholipase domain protein [Chlamydia pneumoniae LPCoLN]
MNKRQKDKLKICVIISTLILVGIFARAPRGDTFKTFLKSEEAIIYSNQCNEDMRKILCDAIEHADEEIFLRIYNLSEPKIQQSLTRQAQAKKKVTIYYQKFKIPQILKQASNVTLVEQPAAGRKLMHQKALSIDKKDAWLGSANYTNLSLRLDNNLILGMHSSELCDLIITNTSGDFSIKDQTGKYFVLPQDRKIAIQAVLEKIQTTQKTIQVAMFALTHSEIIQALHQAKQRGIHVDIIIDRSHSKLTFKQLRQLNINKDFVSINTAPCTLHHKFAVIDNKTLLAGSINWSKGGFSLNDESLIILENLTKRQNQKLRMIWKDLAKHSEHPTVDDEEKEIIEKSLPVEEQEAA